MLHIEERSSWLRLLLKAFSRSASFSESLFCIRLAQEKERNIDQLNFTQSSSLTSTEVGLRHELMFCCLRLLDLTKQLSGDMQKYAIMQPGRTI